MLVSVQLAQSVQLPKADAAVCKSHEEGLAGGVEGDALKRCCCLSKHVQQLEMSILA